MKNLALFPTYRALENYRLKSDRKEFPREEFDILFVEDDAAYKLEGRRYKDVWIHWWCFEEPGYDKCVHLIRSMQAFSDEPGESRLFA